MFILTQYILQCLKDLSWLNKRSNLKHVLILQKRKVMVLSEQKISLLKKEKLKRLSQTVWKTTDLVKPILITCLKLIIHQKLDGALLKFCHMVKSEYIQQPHPSIMDYLAIMVWTSFKIEIQKSLKLSDHIATLMSYSTHQTI